MEIQQGACFYCWSTLKPANTDVDYFIAWARYPIDLGHNFVLADRACNNEKRDRLPAFSHPEAWTDRNESSAIRFARLEKPGIIAELAASNQVARWAYAQAEAANALTRARGEEMVPFDARWRNLLDI